MFVFPNTQWLSKLSAWNIVKIMLCDSYKLNPDIQHFGTLLIHPYIKYLFFYTQPEQKLVSAFVIWCWLISIRQQQSN